LRVYSRHLSQNLNVVFMLLSLRGRIEVPNDKSLLGRYLLSRWNEPSPPESLISAMMRLVTDRIASSAVL
jgi:hypothetical protein